MSALTFLASGGVASSTGDMPDSDQALAGSALKVFAQHVTDLSREFQIPAKQNPLLQASVAFVGKDQLSYHCVFSMAMGSGTQLIYRDLTTQGTLPLSAIVQAVRVEIGEPVAAFSISSQKADTEETNESLKNVAVQYMENLRKSASSESTTLSREALAAPDISSYVESLRADFAAAKRIGFIMMHFSQSPFHEEIVAAIKKTLERFELAGVRADDKEYAAFQI